MYNLTIYKAVVKFIDKQPQHIRQRFYEWTEKLIENPYENHDGKLLKDFFNNLQTYKKRIGKIRILFTIDDENIIIEVYKAGNRGQIYRK